MDHRRKSITFVDNLSYDRTCRSLSDFPENILNESAFGIRGFLWNPANDWIIENFRIRLRPVSRFFLQSKTSRST